MNIELKETSRRLFSGRLNGARPTPLPRELLDAAGATDGLRSRAYEPAVDERLLGIFERAKNPEDPFELRDLWLGRVECELGRHGSRPWLAEQWRTAPVRRRPEAEEVLRSYATVRFVKELFNWYFRDDLYGKLRREEHIILSSGAVDEQSWGLPEVLKECIRFALERDWYGYSDSRGHGCARQAVAAYESARLSGGACCRTENVALTLGGTSSIACVADFLLLGSRSTDDALCAIPNYPPLVESIARRHPTKLVPLSCESGQVCVEALIRALSPSTPLVLLQTVNNPTGAVVPEAEVERLIRAASPSTLILLDECHEWLGPAQPFTEARTASNVVRVSSLSKTWSTPGMKIGWIVADEALIDDYYEYASTTYGGPPSLYYTLVEVLARMERWGLDQVERPQRGELDEFDSRYGIALDRLQLAYESYRRERAARDQALRSLRGAVVRGFAQMPATVFSPRYSINVALAFEGWRDSYVCFRDLLRRTGVSVFPGVLTFCFDNLVRVTAARPWPHLSAAMERLAGATAA